MCPSSKNYVRDYKQERATAKARGETDDNAARKQARRDMEKAGLAKPFDGKEADHKVPLSKGGGTSSGNVRMVSRHSNRSYARNPDGSIKCKK